jgi:hypothetical protein
MKDTTRAAVLAGLAVFATAFAAASLDSTTTTERQAPRGPPGGGGSGEGGLLPPPQRTPLPMESIPVPDLTGLLTLLALVAAVGVVAYAAVYRREALRTVLAIGLVLAALVALLRLLSPPTDLTTAGPGTGVLFGGGGGGTGGQGTARPEPPLSVVLLVTGLAVAGAAAALVRTRGEADDDETAGTDADRRGPDAAAVGRVAARAADRVESGDDVDNAVYRTWREMTDLLDVESPETTTPGEFAAVAVEAGLGRDDVEELTGLFEDVRYGETSPSAARERRAVAVFRRIERRYAEDER